MSEKIKTKSECPLCKLPEEEQFMIRSEVLTGKSICADIARRYDHLNVNADDVHNHIYYHHIDVKEVDGLGIDHIYEKTSNLVTKLERFFNLVTLNETVPDEKTIRMITSMTRELRETLKMAVELENKYGDQKTKNKIEKYKKQYDKLKEILMGETCDECKEKIFNRLKLEHLL